MNTRPPYRPSEAAEVCSVQRNTGRKGDLSRFIEEAVRAHLLERAVDQAKTAAASMSETELTDLIDEAFADLEAELVDLSKADQERVAQALLSPPPPSPALERAFERRTRALEQA